MKKKQKIERRPIPEEHGRAFMATVWTMAKAFGIDQMTSACHYLQLAGEEIDRALFEQKNPAVSRHRDDTERRRFITNFKTRWLTMTDYEYDRAISPVEAKMVGQLCKELGGKGFNAEEYLRWVFEDFLPVNEKFCPPMLKWMCSSFIVNKFFYEHREYIKKKKEDAIRSKMSVDLVNRARVCMRLQTEEKREKLKKYVQDFSERRITIEMMRAFVEEQEEFLRQATGQQG